MLVLFPAGGSVSGGETEPRGGETEPRRGKRGKLGMEGRNDEEASSGSSSRARRNGTCMGNLGAAQQQAAFAQAHKLTWPTSPKPGCLLVSSLLVSRENQVGLGVGILLKRWTESRIWVWGFRVSACQHGT